MLRDANLPAVEVHSAGTLAATGSPGCPMSPALEGRADEHASQPLSVSLIGDADLVLAAAREHRAAVVAMDPRARVKTFTIRQAGRLAQWLLDAGMVDAAVDGPEVCDPQDPRSRVAPMPAAEPARVRWVVEELDAARGMAAAPTPSQPQGRRWSRRSAEPEQHPDDVPDPHVLGMDWHGPAYEQLREATGQLVVLLQAIQPPTD